MTKKSAAMTKHSSGGTSLSVQDLRPVMDVLLQAWSEEKRSGVELAKVEATRAIAIQAIRHKHDLYRSAFEHIFAERRLVISKHFDVIDRGMQRNDSELILAGLRGLGQVVASSPFSDLKSLAQALEGGPKIKI